MIENIPQEQLPIVQPTPNSPKVWLPFVVALVVVALVSGGGVYLWQQNEIKQLQNNQPRQIGNINNQVAPTINPNADTRALLTTSNAYSENTAKMGGMSDKACDEDFNHEPANTNVAYKNIDKGLELSIPYNKNWGSKNYRINPYDEEKNGISFGEFTIGEGCSWLRNYQLSFETSKSKEIVKKDILASGVVASNSIKEYSLQNMPVFMWAQEGPGCWTGAEFIGVKANYKFSFNGNCDESKDLKTLEMLASLMKQI
jgi:hypothetical protein